jgi:hypothetical protein
LAIVSLPVNIAVDLVGRPVAIRLHLMEGPPVRRQQSGLPRHVLPTGDRCVDIERIEFDGGGSATGSLSGQDRDARANKRIENNSAAL